jgi:hypothetical protein
LRIQALESLDFSWDPHDAQWKQRLSELAAFREEYQNCNVPRSYSKNIQLGQWVHTQRGHYKKNEDGKYSSLTLPRIEALESLGFQWSLK